MSANDVRLFVRRWWFIGAMLFGLGKWVTDLQGAVSQKADTSDVTEMKWDIKVIKEEVRQMSERQQQFMCADRPVWCR